MSKETNQSETTKTETTDSKTILKIRIVDPKKKKLSPKDLALKKLQKKFDQATLNKRIDIFKIARRSDPSNNKAFSAANNDFCELNWHKLIDLISTVKIGMAVYHALSHDSAAKLEIWPTVAALKTIKIWGKNKTISQMSDEGHKMINAFPGTLSINQVLEITAQMILEKMSM